MTLPLFGSPMDLPERVRVLSMWGRWASAVANGDKTKETRTWTWPYDPGWLAIHASLRWDGEFRSIDGMVPERIEPFPEAPAVEPGALCALVWVARSRPMTLADKPAALIWHPALQAWDIERVRRLAPVKMRGPQKFSSVSREVVVKALAEATS